jgi:4-nitrophenyl phosphatase
MSTLDLTEIEALIVDMDGVLWVGDQPLPGLNEFFGFLDAHGVPFVLATNNASRTPSFYVDRMAGYGVSIGEANILTSSLATADWMRGEFPGGARVYVVGQDGLREAMVGAGFEVVPDTSEPVDAVVGGIDFTLTYEKLRDAVLHIGHGARFIGTNGDVNYPSELGLAPGGGAILAAIQAATGAEPTIVGKPKRPMFDAAVARLERDRSSIAMVGDRLDTDILGAHRARLHTILVSTGVDSPATIRETGIIPDVVYDDLPALTAAWMEQLS